MHGMHPKDSLGRAGERAAADLLTASGLRIVDRNWRCRHGELDLVAREGATWVFVEVKTRRGRRFGHPLESITATKLRRLRTLATLWMQVHDVRGPMRLDAVAVDAPHDLPMRLEHVRGIR